MDRSLPAQHRIEARLWRDAQVNCPANAALPYPQSIAPSAD
jgi:hypothetical protein